MLSSLLRVTEEESPHLCVNTVHAHSASVLDTPPLSRDMPLGLRCFKVQIESWCSNFTIEPTPYLASTGLVLQFYHWVNSLLGLYWPGAPTIESTPYLASTGLVLLHRSDYSTVCGSLPLLSVTACDMCTVLLCTFATSWSTCKPHLVNSTRCVQCTVVWHLYYNFVVYYVLQRCMKALYFI